jgi:hypothetical protein
MRKAESSIKVNSLQQADRISLKQKLLKIGHFRARHESALGTVDRMIVFRYLQVDHLSKQQVIALDGSTSIGLGDFACGIFSYNFDYTRAVRT